MFKKQVSSGVIAAAVILLLALIQFAYWALLGRQKAQVTTSGGGAMAGGGGRDRILDGHPEVAVETFAGDDAGYADGPSWQARFCGPNALALEAEGSLLVADSRNHRIRRVTPGGRVTTVAGSGEADGEGGRAEGAVEAAAFRYPSGVAAHGDGTIYVGDTGNHRICRIRDGQVTVLAGGAEGKGDGFGPAARFRYPAALALDSAGALWIADTGNQAVRQLDAAGQVTTPAAVPPEIAEALGDVKAPGAARRLLAWSEGGGDPAAAPGYRVGRLAGFTRAPGAAPTLPRLAADVEHHTLMVRSGSDFVLAAGRRSAQFALAGLQDSGGNRARLAAPAAVAMTRDGTVYVADYEGNRIRRVRLPGWLREGSVTAPRQGQGRFGGRRRRGR